VVIGLLTGCRDITNFETVGYAYPSVVNVVAISRSRATKDARFNQVFHYRDLVDHHGASGVVSPNNDTLYSGLFLDLRTSPQIVKMPSFAGKRYQSLMVNDMRSYNIAEIINDGSGGQYLFAVKGFKGEVPEGVRLYEPLRPYLEGGWELPQIIKHPKTQDLTNLVIVATDFDILACLRSKLIR